MLRPVRHLSQQESAIHLVDTVPATDTADIPSAWRMSGQPWDNDFPSRILLEDIEALAELILKDSSLCVGFSVLTGLDRPRSQDIVIQHMLASLSIARMQQSVSQ